MPSEHDSIASGGAARWPLAQVLSRLPLPATAKWPQGVFDTEVFASPGLRLSLFAPRGEDRQSAHDEDEFYLVAHGRAVLHVRDRRDGWGILEAASGDALFVAAGIEHRFESISADFTAWVVFFPATAPRESP